MIRALACLILIGAAHAATVRVRLTQPDGGRILAMDLEDYVAAVLAGESSVFRSGEALKAMAVAARTYAVRLRGRHAKEGFDFCATTHCQRAAPKGVTGRLESAADETAGELLWFEGRPVFACYTRDCGGHTEDGAALWPDLYTPYLKSHDDPYCRRAGSMTWQWSGSAAGILGALRESGLRGPHRLEEIRLKSRTQSGRAEVLSLDGGGEQVPVSAGSFRLAIGRAIGWDTLRSDRYRLSFANGHFLFDGSGAGHGAGLCQRGADLMGSEGHSYREILSFYYPGTVAGLTARGLKWTRLGGEFVTVMSTSASTDAPIVEQAERVARTLSERTRLALPARIEIRIYPDVETFRNATGAPGSVAGETRGSRIYLQPVRVLRDRGAFESTLRHELLHVLVENRLRPGYPVSDRERMVDQLERTCARDTGEGTCAAIPELQNSSRSQDATKNR